MNLRRRELVTSGALGGIRRMDLVLATPAPPDADPRWSPELAGGATMDLGCYVLDAARQLGRWIGAAPQIVTVDAALRALEADGARDSPAMGALPCHQGKARELTHGRRWG